eukprot:m.362742 g.362742  ORF g.362742 m.362742 type:complete len:59 (-) comp56020_c0_seq4:223-399(-)
MTSTKKEKQVQSAQYELFGVIVHSGLTTHSGHYFSYVRGEDGTWFHMNDEVVRRRARC